MQFNEEKYVDTNNTYGQTHCENTNFNKQYSVYLKK